MKKCSRCEVLKEESDFHKNKYSKDGLKACCKSCASEDHKIYHKKYYKKNREILIKISHEYRKKNKEILLQKSRNRYKRLRENNPEILRSRHKKWRDNNKKRISEYGKRYRKENSQLIKSIQAKWREKNKEKLNYYRKNNKHRFTTSANKYARNQIENIGEWYIKQLLNQAGFTRDQIEAFPELIDAKVIKVIKHRINKISKNQQS